MRLIDADEFKRVMYHEAFETDSDLQKWDSGCWIRYKMFENAIENFPAVDVVPVVHGHWGEPQRDGCITYDKNAYRQCSVCGNRQFLGMQMNYCPQCGAKMDATDINVGNKEKVTE